MYNTDIVVVVYVDQRQSRGEKGGIVYGDPDDKEL